MAETQKTGDYFGTFLETLKGQEEAEVSNASSALGSILTALQAGPQPIPELAKTTGLGLVDLTAEVHAAQTAGYLTLSGLPGEEVATLTAAGSELASRVAQR